MIFKLTPEQAQKLEKTIKARYPRWETYGFPYVIRGTSVETYDPDVIEIIQKMQK